MDRGRTAFLLALLTFTIFIIGTQLYKPVNPVNPWPYGYSISSSITVPTGTYQISQPISIGASGVSITCQGGAVIQAKSQIDGGMIQLSSSAVANSYSNVVFSNGCVLDGNNLAMSGVWVAKRTPGWQVLNTEIKNIMGVAGLQNIANPNCILAHGGGNPLVSNSYCHDISSPNYNGGNGECWWITGDQGITIPENAIVKNSRCANTMNVAQYELIGGMKFDTNTLGISAINDTFTNLSGDGIEWLAGGSPNFSNNHTISQVTITNARICINLNANNGGTVRYGQILNSVATNCRSYGIYENLGTDYITFIGNNVPQGRIVNPIGGSPHDVLQNNVGF